MEKPSRNLWRIYKTGLFQNPELIRSIDDNRHYTQNPSQGQAGSP